MFKVKKTEKIETESLYSLETENPSQPKKSIFCTYSPLSHAFLQKTKFKVICKNNKATKDLANSLGSYGLWDKSEHNKFIEALYLYNCAWTKIESYLKNRTYKQIRSHAQKFYLKLKSFKDEELGLDFTSPYVKDLKDIIKIIEEKESINQNCGKLLYIISEKISFGKNIDKEKPNKQFIKKKRKAQLNNFEYKNVNINNSNNNEKFNNTSHLDFEDLLIETNENQNQNQSLNYIEYDDFLFNDVCKEFDDTFIVNNDIKKDPNFLITILS